MTVLKALLLIAVGFGSGVVIAGAVFAFISVVGIVPKMARKTGTRRYVKLYEEAIMAGGVLGTVMSIFSAHLPLPGPAIGAVSLLTGIFYGVLAVSLAEVLDVIPILTRRGRVQRGMLLFVLAIAIGKMAGSLLYYFVPGFFKP